MSQVRAESDMDLFSDANLADPYPRYRELRDLPFAGWIR